MKWHPPTPEEFKAFSNEVSEDSMRLLDQLLRKLGRVSDMEIAKQVAKLSEWLLERVAEPIQRMMTTVRPPRIYLVGAQNVGKSSIVNALLGADEAVVTVFEPQEPQSEPFVLKTSELEWHIYDRAGIGEATGHEESLTKDRVQALLDEIPSVKPDVILFVINASQPMATLHEFQAIKQIRAGAEAASGRKSRIVLVLNRADQISGGQFAERFPKPEVAEEFRTTISAIMKTLNEKVLGSKELIPIDADDPCRGLLCKNDPEWSALVPLCVVSEPQVRGRRWNIDTLRRVLIENALPPEALMGFVGKNPPKETRCSLAKRLVYTFVGFSLPAGAIPVVDLIAVDHIEALLVGSIGRLNEEPLNLATVQKFRQARGGAFGWLRKILAKLPHFLEPLGKWFAERTVKKEAEALGKKAAAKAVKEAVKQAGKRGAYLARGAGFAVAALIGGAMAGIQIYRAGTKAIVFFFPKRQEQV